MATISISYSAPSSWASYLINGDASGLEPDEITACDAWTKMVWRFNPSARGPVDCKDIGFRKYHDARHLIGGRAADCQEYYFLANA